MRRFICAIVTSCALGACGGHRTGQGLANDVQIDPNGMRFGLCDNFWEALDAKAMVSQLELSADRPLAWFLHDPASYIWRSVVFLGMSNSFAFTLKSPDGTPVPKTPKGEGMSAGPASLTDLLANRFVRGRGAGFSDFPKLTELFRFPSNGVYLLEVRYWAYSRKEKKFSLSAPVRLKVIKQEPAKEPTVPKRGEK
jgi:hypothetical protein